MFIPFVVSAVAPLLARGLQLIESRQGQEPYTKPHILFILVDDLGWADVSFTRPSNDDGPSTPQVDSLVADGVKLNRHYVHKTCSPTRSAIQSGRDPIHVNVLNLQVLQHAAGDKVAGAAGIPRNMTGIAEVLRGAGYSTHMVGKWDAGMATPDHTPAGRGYESSLVFYNHDTDCWTFKATRSPCFIQGAGQEWKSSYFYDLWEHDADITYPGRPAEGKLNRKDCWFKNQHPEREHGDTDKQGRGSCKFMDSLFEERVQTIIKTHDSAKPFFIFWSFRSIHADYQPPDEEQSAVKSALFRVHSKISMQYYSDRSDYFGMVRWVDGAIGRTVDLLKEKGFYDNTLIVFSSDNGGTPGGNSYPLRGSKWSNWEGGIRAPAFVSGGFVPKHRRGSSTGGLITAWDWYATLARLAGVSDITDLKARKAGLPKVDSIDVWNLIVGKDQVSPRQAVYIGDVIDDLDTKAEGQTTVGGIIYDKGKVVWKLLLGMGANHTMRCSAWGHPTSFMVEYTAKRFPTQQFCDVTQVCGPTPETGCLFDVRSDPAEENNKAAQNPEVFQEMMRLIVDMNRTVFSPYRGKPKNSEMCEKGRDEYQGFWGPFAK